MFDFLLNLLSDWDSATSSSGESDEEGSSTDESETEADGAVADGDCLLSSESGSDDDDEVDKCPVCLRSLRDQDIGMPESCDHDFCLDCIVEWSKVRTLKKHNNNNRGQT